MKKQFELEAYVKVHPDAARDIQQIGKTMQKLKKLRAEGIGGEGYSLVQPFGRRRSFFARPRFDNQTELKRTLFS